MDKKENILENIFEFLDNISNAVGSTITEYHWREAEGLKKSLCEEFDINYKSIKPRNPHDNVSKEDEDSENSVIPIPNNVEEAIEYLITYSPDVYNWAQGPEYDAVISQHHIMGRTIRNIWGLWEDSKLSVYFKNLGVTHPDDMSKCILVCLHRHINEKPLQLSEQIKKIKLYYKEHTNTEL